MKRYYFKSRSLEAFAEFEAELEAKGITRDRIHVVSLDANAEEPRLNLHTMADFMKSDLIRDGLVGFGFGAVLATGFIALALAMEWHNTPLSWPPVAFGAALIFGFCTWQGGYLGIRQLNHRFRKWEQNLEAGEHLMFVELEAEHPALREALRAHPQVQSVGSEKGRPSWTLTGQQRLRHLVTEQLP